MIYLVPDASYTTPGKTLFGRHDFFPWITQLDSSLAYDLFVYPYRFTRTNR